MLMNPDDIEVSERGSQREFFDRPIGGDPELALLETGRDVGVRFRIDVGIDAQGDPCLSPDGSGHLINRLQLSRGFDVEHEDVGLQGLTDLLRVLTDAREDDL